MIDRPSAIETWTYLPKRMSSGKIVWWDSYYIVDKFTSSADPRHIYKYTETYTKEEWFIYLMSHPSLEHVYKL